MLKENYYENRVKDLKSSNISQWYSKLKRMSTVDPTKEEVIEVEELMEFSNQIQAEKIADHYSLISNQYGPIKLEDFKSEGHDSKSLPLLEPYQVYLKMKKMKKSPQQSLIMCLGKSF